MKLEKNISGKLTFIHVILFLFIALTNNKLGYSKSSERTFPASPIIKPTFQTPRLSVTKPSIKNYRSKNVSPVAAVPAPIYGQSISTQHNTPPEAMKSEAEIKISTDHISVLFYNSLEEALTIEFLLRETDQGYAFFETQPPGPLDPWRVPLDKYLKSLHLPTTLLVQGLLRLDRWAVPGMERMVSHAVCSVQITKDQRESLLDVRNEIFYEISDLL